METITQSAQETQRLGEKIGRDLKGGEVLALYGELGSGKTTFIQGLAKGLGIEKRIISPTFIFVREYPFKGGIFYHVDLYRIEKEADARSLGLEEMFDSGAIIALEWAEKIKKILPQERVDIFFEYLDDQKRKIRVIKQ